MTNKQQPLLSPKDSKRGGFYWIEGKPFVSVTQVLGDVLRKPGLEYWMKEQIYLAMVADPTLEKAKALAAPKEISEDAKLRGQTVHDIIEAWKQTQTYIETIPEKFKGYAQAFYQFIKDQDIEILEHERTVISEKYGYAGTLDLLMKSKKNGRTFLIDAKTGKGVYPEFFLQLSAYKQALSEGGTEVDTIGVLLLKEDGTYAFELGGGCLDVFLAVLKIWEWKNKDLIEKLGVETREQPMIDNFALGLRQYEFEAIVQRLKEELSPKKKPSGKTKGVKND